MKKIAVTGGAGKLGRWVVEDLLARGYEVLSIDRKEASNERYRHTSIDLNNYGEVYDALNGSDAVIHLAAVPGPKSGTPEYIFGNNVRSTYHVLEAAAALGMTKAVVGSSESIYGIRWSVKAAKPLYVPVDEDHPQQVSECYGLSKQVNEITASMFNQSSGMQIVSLRFANIFVPEEYAGMRETIGQPEKYKLNYWSYVDVRDAASACRAALEADGVGTVALNITADDTFTDTDTLELLKRFYPDITDIREPMTGNALVFSNRKAKQVLDWKPAHSWRDGMR